MLVEDGAVGLVQLHVDGDCGGIDLILSPSARGQGTGRRVVDAIVSRERERNIARLAVDPVVQNGRGARFWRAVGFELHSTITDDVGQAPHVLMSRSANLEPESVAEGLLASVHDVHGLEADHHGRCALIGSYSTGFACSVS